MKLYPIKVEPVKVRYTNIVEWMLGNTCNYDCSFCGEQFKSGSHRFLELSTYKNVIDKVINQGQHKKTWFKLTGGEPTLYPKLIELLKYIKEKDQLTYVISNGTRTLRFWEEVKASNSLDIIAFSYHPEQTNNLQHLLNVVELFKDTPTIVLVNVTCLPKYFNEATSAFDIIKKQSTALVNLQQINDNYGMSKYSDEQKKILLEYSHTKTDNYHLKKLSNIGSEYSYHSGLIKYTYNDGTELTDHAIKFIKNEEDNFFGYSCDAGMSYIRIVYTDVIRSTCGAGETWSIYDENIFQKNPIICPYKSCTCTLDMIITKNKIL
jgi:organic radical activating enzyme